MVAVTVAMAAVAYAYFTGLIGGNSQEVVPVFELRADELNDRLVVSSADTDANWQRISISADKTGTSFKLNDNVAVADTDITTSLKRIAPTSTPMHATDYLDFGGDTTTVTGITYAIVDTVANSEIGTYTFQSIVQLS